VFNRKGDGVLVVFTQFRVFRMAAREVDFLGVAPSGNGGLA
jgi:hypothetical protein